MIFTEQIWLSDVSRLLADALRHKTCPVGLQDHAAGAVVGGADPDAMTALEHFA